MAKLNQFRRRHPLALLGLLAVAFLAAGCGALSALNSSGDDQPASGTYFEVPEAPRLVSTGEGQVVYRIDAGRSSVSYEVKESLAGTEHTANGSTKGVAGDVLVDTADPTRTQVGEIVVNVQQLTSDQSVRDSRLRHDFLQSDDFPLARFATTGIEGLPSSIADGQAYDLTLNGDLTVKETTLPASFAVTATRQGDELRLTGSTTVSLAAYGVGPISLIGLVSAEDAATITLDVVAVDASTIEATGNLAFAADTGSTGTTAAGGGPSFSAQVQPVLERNCASCHNTGTSGSTVWTLDDAGDAQESASGIGLVTRSRYMPPWPASDASVPFDHSLRLSDEDLATLVSWAEAGGPIDVPAETPIVDSNPNVRHPDQDVVLTADAPYQGSTDLSNDYRCLVMDPKVAEQTVVTGYEFIPDQTEYVHHALVYRLHADSREAIEARDAADEGTGYQCFGGVAAEGSLDPAGRGGGAELVGGWAPGQLPSIYPEGSGMSLEAGDFFVTQVHYHFVHQAPPDRSSLVLQLADDDPAAYDDVHVTTYLAPAEIPCGPGESGPLCDRDTVLAQLERDYGPSAPFIANGLHALCRTSIEELAVLDGTVASSSCDHRVRNEGEILSVLGHMHEIGATYRMTLNPGTPDEKVLLDIPNWDFGWQLQYKPTESITLKKGDVVRVECTWDRARLNPLAEPRYVTWNEGTEDEMCYSTIATRERRTP